MQNYIHRVSYDNAGEQKWKILPLRRQANALSLFRIRLWKPGRSVDQLLLGVWEPSYANAEHRSSFEVPEHQHRTYDNHLRPFASLASYSLKYTPCLSPPPAGNDRLQKVLQFSTMASECRYFHHLHSLQRLMTLLSSLFSANLPLPVESRRRSTQLSVNA